MALPDFLSGDKGLFFDSPIPYSPLCNPRMTLVVMPDEILRKDYESVN